MSISLMIHGKQSPPVQAAEIIKAVPERDGHQDAPEAKARECELFLRRHSGGREFRKQRRSQIGSALQNGVRHPRSPSLFFLSRGLVLLNCAVVLRGKIAR